MRQRRAEVTTPKPARDVPDNPIRGRWVTLAIVIMAAFIVVLDNTVLNVAIPTILRDFDTTLPSLEWVVTGYSLDVRDVPDHRRPARRHLRPPPHLHHRRRALRRRIVPRVGLAVGAAARPRRGDDRGHRRVADAAGDARDPLDDVPGPRAGHRVRGVGRDRRRRGRVRAGGRRLPHDELLVALVVPDQRHHRARSRSSARCLHAAPATATERRLTHRRRSARCSSPSACSCSSSRSARAARTAGGSRSRTFTVGGHDVWPASAPISIIPLAFSRRRSRSSSPFVSRRTRQGTAATAIRSSSSRTCGIKTYRYGLLTGLVLAMGQLGLSFVLPRVPAGRQAPHRGAERAVAAARPGLFIIVGAQVGGRLIRAIGTTVVVRARPRRRTPLGMLLMLHAISLDITCVAAPARPRALRHRHRLRGRAAHERRPVRDPDRELGRRERREHDRAPGRRARSASR